jgi:hypothetical protein
MKKRKERKTKKRDQKKKKIGKPFVFLKFCTPGDPCPKK